MQIKQNAWRITLFSLCMCLFFSQQVFGIVEIRNFDDRTEENRFRLLNKELRCPKCQNQNIEDSNAPIAVDMRAAVYLLLKSGKTDAEIKQYLVERYGDFVLYRPEFNGTTAILWLGPVVTLLVGIMLWFLFTHRGARCPGESKCSDPVQSESEKSN